jgi:cytoskeletal protein CcmA (bactofilin family)
MFGKDKDNQPGKDQDAPTSYVPEVTRPPLRSLLSVSVASPPAQTERVSTISSGMTIFGKVIGDGDVNVFGRIEGELQAANILICIGAQVEGNVVAEQLTVGGRVKGTIHAVRVKLQGTADVEGDIFHRSLAIEENAKFEGTSRREETHPEKTMVAQAKNTKAETQIGTIEANGKYRDTPDIEDLRPAG